MAFALKHSYEWLSLNGRSMFSFDMDGSMYGPAQRDGIVLVYHGSSIQSTKEELEVFCGERFTSLAVSNIPPQRCSDPEFSEAVWAYACNLEGTQSFVYDLQGIKPLFYAKCTRSNDPRMGYRKIDEVDSSLLAGYQRIQNYVPGQVSSLRFVAPASDNAMRSNADLCTSQLVSVYAVRGKLWLAAYIYGIPIAVDPGRANQSTFGWVDSADYLRLQQQPHPSCEFTWPPCRDYG